MARSDKKHHIMKAAEKLFANRRFHEVTVDEVARLSSVGKGTIYRYFADKDDLFFETVTMGFDEVCDLLDREVPADAPFKERLLGACFQIREFFERRTPLFRMMQSEGSRVLPRRGELKERWLAHRRKLIATLAEILAQGAGSGAVRTDVAPEVLAAYLLGMLRAAARDLPDGHGNTEGVELTTELFLCGAAAPAARGVDASAIRRPRAKRPRGRKAPY